MIYAENIFVALAIPLVIAAVLLKGSARRFTGFYAAGLAACLLASYINGFLASASGMTELEVTIRLTPICEELLKAFPVFFFAAVFEPKRSDLFSAAVAVGLGFATLESVCQIVAYGAAEFYFVLLRGFSAGAMHTISSAMLGYGLALLSRRRLILLPGSFGLLCAASVLHSLYNLFVTAWGAWRIVGYALPLATTAALYLLFGRRLEIRN